MATAMAIDMKLLNETKSLLMQHIDAGTAIALEADDEDQMLIKLLELLHRYELARSRKITVVACYLLIRLAISKHKELTLHENEKLTRGILDGDYLLGLYYRLLVGRKEWQLFTHLATFNKNMQAALMAGTPIHSIMMSFHEELRAYLDKQCA